MLANIDLIIWRHWIVVSKRYCDSVWSSKPLEGGGWAPNELQIDPPKWMIHPPQKKNIAWKHHYFRQMIGPQEKFQLFQPLPNENL